jgi:aminoglycoside phosphotransferase (APT) family kinase protein
MTTPQSEPSALAGIDLPAVQRHLDEQLPAPLSEPLRAELVPGGRSNVTYIVSAGDRRWVLRRPPLGSTLDRAHDVGREYRVMSALASTPVPVPRMVSLCSDPALIGAPFYIMEYVDGAVLRTREQVASLDAAARAVIGAQLVDALAAIHEVVPSDVGLERLGPAKGYLERQIARWLRQFEQVRIRPLPGLDRLGSQLQSSIPDEAKSTIVHGDFRLDNTIIDLKRGNRVAAVLDWELATLGDPLADLGTLLMFWDEPDKVFNPITNGLMAFPGFPSRADAIERYATRCGIEIEDVTWYIAFAGFRLAVILEQLYVRSVKAESMDERRGQLEDMVGKVIANALDELDREGR